MNEYVIVSDSTCDLTPEMLEEWGVTIIPMEFEIDGKRYLSYPDERDMRFKDFYAMLRAGKPSGTTQVSLNSIRENFEPILEAGKDILYIAFSSGLSGTYSTAMLAISELSEKYPDRKMYALDSRGATLGEGLQVYYAASLKKEGKTIDEVFSWLKEHVPNLCHWYTVDDLKHLHRGGRISTASALIGTMLGIKPVLNIDEEGHLILIDKARGRVASIKELFKHMEELIIEPKGQMIFIGHGDCYDDACILRDMIKEKYGNEIKGVEVHYIGPIVGTHSGPGTIALFFLGKHR